MVDRLIEDFVILRKLWEEMEKFKENIGLVF